MSWAGAPGPSSYAEAIVMSPFMLETWTLTSWTGLEPLSGTCFSREKFQCRRA